MNKGILIDLETLIKLALTDDEFRENLKQGRFQLGHYSPKCYMTEFCWDTRHQKHKLSNEIAILLDGAISMGAIELLGKNYINFHMAKELRERTKIHIEYSINLVEADARQLTILTNNPKEYGREIQTPLISPKALKNNRLLRPPDLYRQLESYLQQRRWKDADWITYYLMLNISKKSITGLLTQEDLQNFPADEWEKIDGIWQDNSRKKFGFCKQMEIYKEVGGKRGYYQETWEQFGESVGWRKPGQWTNYRDLEFDCGDPDKFPQAYLPLLLRFGFRAYSRNRWWLVCSSLNRLEAIAP